MRTLIRRILLHPSLGAVAACILWSGAFIFIKIGVEYAPPLQFAGLRFTISGLLLVPLAYRTMGCSGARCFFSRLRARAGVLLLLGVVQIGVKYALFYLGLVLLPASLAAMLGGVGPIVVAIVAHLVLPDDRLTWRKIAALLGGAVGVLVLTLGRHTLGAVGPWAILGIVLILGNNLVSAFGDIWVRRESRFISPTTISCTSLITGGLALLLAGWTIEGPAPMPRAPIFYLSLAVLCLISSGAFTIWFNLLRRPGVEVSSLNIWKFLIPLLGALLAWIVLPDESPSLVAVVGMVFIVASLLILQGGFVRFWYFCRGLCRPRHHVSSDFERVTR